MLPSIVRKEVLDDLAVDCRALAVSHDNVYGLRWMLIDEPLHDVDRQHPTQG